MGTQGETLRLAALFLLRHSVGIYIETHNTLLAVGEGKSMRRIPMAEWSHKDERQYEHIRDSEEKRGVNEERAREIAARTVNKRRREEGRTPNKTTQGVGNPTHALEDRSKPELYNRAKELDIDGRSKMHKAQLIEAIRDCESG